METAAWPRFQPAGDSAVLVQLGEHIDPRVNRQVHVLTQALRERSISGLGEAVPGYATLLVHYDPQAVQYAQVVAYIIQNLSPGEVLSYTPRRVEIPVVYGGAYGPDLAFIAEHTGLSESEVVRIHAAGTYTVYMMGFMPGFPYLGGMDAVIAAPRLSTPRAQVPAGSVGIAGEQTGVYPLESPGGWRIIGRTPLVLFDAQREPPFLLSPGDEVRFVPVESMQHGD